MPLADPEPNIRKGYKVIEKKYDIMEVYERYAALEEGNLGVNRTQVILDVIDGAELYWVDLMMHGSESQQQTAADHIYYLARFNRLWRFHK